MKEITVSEEFRVDSSGSSDGTQDKYQRDGIWYKIDRKGNEGCNENIVSGILACSNLPQNGYVSYECVLINGNPGCMSKEFTKAGEEEITLYRLYANTEGGDIINRLSTMDYDDAIDYTVDFVQRNTGLDIREYLANTIALDRLTLNTDRHMNNLSVIFDRNAGKFKEAPIYDNGRAFFCGDAKYDPGRSVEENMRHLVFRPFSASANLMYEYLKEALTLSIDEEKLKKFMQGLDTGIAKDVLEYQLTSNGFDYIRKGK